MRFSCVGRQSSEVQIACRSRFAVEAWQTRLILPEEAVASKVQLGSRIVTGDFWTLKQIVGRFKICTLVGQF